MELVEAVSGAEAAVAELASAGIDDCGATTLRDELRRLKRVQSQLDGQLARLTHAADTAGAFIGTGARDTAEWLALTTGTSTRRNRSAADLGAAMAGSDTLTAAITAGAVSSDQASAAIGAAAGQPLDDEILDTIADLPVTSVKPTVERWRARTDPDSEADRAETQRARRYLHVTDQPDGMTRIDGMVDPASGAIIRASLDGVMEQSWNDGTIRTRDQRCADALVQVCAAAAKGELRGGRSNTKLIVTVPYETLLERAGDRGISHVGPTLDRATVRQLACDAGIHRLITGPASSILDFGHEARTVSDNLFLALVARDQHCRWPGCTVRATWCDAHHIVHHALHGPTNDDNLVLLCHRHHQVAHQPNWSMHGTGAVLTVQRPDGHIETTRPPTAEGSAATGTDPPTVHASRAGCTGRQPPSAYGSEASAAVDDAPWNAAPEQLTLA